MSNDRMHLGGLATDRTPPPTTAPLEPLSLDELRAELAKEHPQHAMATTAGVLRVAATLLAEVDRLRSQVRALQGDAADMRMRLLGGKGLP